MRALRLLWRYPVITATVVVLALVLILHATGQQSAGRWIATAYVAVIVVWTLVGMIRDVIRGQIGLDVLAVVAMVATIAVGEYLASLIIVLMLSGGEALEDFAARRAKRDLTALLDRSPRIAHVLVHPQSESDEVQDAAVDDVVIGDVLLVRPSEIVPVDGILLSDTGTFDESSLTGESMPVTREAGGEVLSGAINGTRAVRIRALRRSADSQYQQIIALVNAAQDSRAPVVRLADRFAVPFTAVSLVLAGTAWALSGDSTRFAEVLVLATPCPLLIAAPVAFLGGLSRAAKRGLIMKGGAVIEQLARVRSAAFDKTGTLTVGRPELVDVRPAEGFDADDVLQLAASAEQYSSHVLAEGIRRAARERGLELLGADSASEVATNGVTAVIEGRTIVVGKPAYVAPDEPRPRIDAGQAAAYVSVDGRFAGVLVLADAARPESAGVISWLRAHGVERIAMLTGDMRTTAESIAGQVGIDEIHAELLPPEKVQLAAGLRPRPMMMVGDGVNDAPVLAASDIGIAMGAKGATAAGEAADIVVLVDSLDRVVDGVAIGRHTVRVALTAIWIGIALSIGLMIIAMTGVIPAVVGALTQELVDLATILYALRALSGPPTGLAVGREPTRVVAARVGD
ncbi:MAG: cadmium-translocating P-type ATPase [Microbacterium sp. SCN 70-200]|uniref:heavy metal translocating P-type ATPase n=1 Tax=unclassified Microbacterium TaxID=2609290 RepID=UPI00086E0EE2|nr:MULTISPECIES: heavy metal translocating P-type ATPase [unclassified Microbacterium]MBN9216215.1 cadmium-translocating P-type ATPase [Microbacterium sp.]ODT41801.1 MAG: cadmium-translocating P-type ATPase [Microbacterium sp. SCN 70-200]OJV84490.1 MAG: cadmium-translocating P-type ATPase [Microbacterium sp. 70-16]